MEGADEAVVSEFCSNELAKHINRDLNLFACAAVPDITQVPACMEAAENDK